MQFWKICVKNLYAYLYTSQLSQLQSGQIDMMLDQINIWIFAHVLSALS